MTTQLTKSTSAVTAKQFMAKVQEQFVNKYAQDVVIMLEDQKRLKKALEKVNEYLEEVEKGNYDVIEKYKSMRKRLEYEDDLEIS